MTISSFFAGLLGFVRWPADWSVSSLLLAPPPALLPLLPPPAPPRNVTSWATTSTLLRFCPSFSHVLDCKRPLTRHGRPLVKYCATLSPSGPQATTSIKSVASCHSPSPPF